MSTTVVIVIVVAIAIAALIVARVNGPRVTQIDRTIHKKNDRDSDA